MASAIGASITLDAAVTSVLARDGYDSVLGGMVPLAYSIDQLADALEGEYGVWPDLGQLILALGRLRSAGRIISRTHAPTNIPMYRRATK